MAARERLSSLAVYELTHAVIPDNLLWCLRRRINRIVEVGIMYTVRDNIIRGVSWSGAFFGLIVAVVTYLFLSMAGVAIGGAVFSFDNAREVGWGTLGWMALSLGVSAYAGGYAAAKAAPGIITSFGGTVTGLLCGAMFLISLTFLVGNSIVSAGQAAFGVVRGAAQTIPQLVPQGIIDDTQNMLRGIDRADVQDAIRKAAPELGETQVAAATESVVRTGRESVGRIRASLRNPRQLGDVLRGEADTVYRQLTGSEFVNRLEQQGLNSQQAQQVATALEQRVNDMRNQLQNASQQISDEARKFTEEAAKAVSKAAWIWLGVALLIVGFSFLGGRNGSDQEGVEARLREDEDVDQFRTQRPDRVEPLHPHH